MNNRKIAGKPPKYLEIKQHIWNNTWVKEDSRENNKCFRPNENENTSYQNLWDSAKAVLTGKFIALNAYIRKEGSKISNLSFHL